MQHDWPVKKAIVDLPIKMKGNWKYISSNLLSLRGAQNKDIGAALQRLLTEVKLRLWQCAFFSSIALREITFSLGKSCNRRNLTLEQEPPCLSSNNLNTTYFVSHLIYTFVTSLEKRTLTIFRWMVQTVSYPKNQWKPLEELVNSCVSFNGITANKLCFPGQLFFYSYLHQNHLKLWPVLLEPPMGVVHLYQWPG